MGMMWKKKERNKQTNQPTNKQRVTGISIGMMWNKKE